MRADIHDGPEHKLLQSEAGYIDARPQCQQIDETLLRRTAGPYIRVKIAAATMRQGSLNRKRTWPGQSVGSISAI
jgi:hypothetical protein